MLDRLDIKSYNTILYYNALYAHFLDFRPSKSDKFRFNNASIIHYIIKFVKGVSAIFSDNFVTYRLFAVKRYKRIIAKT